MSPLDVNVNEERQTLAPVPGVGDDGIESWDEAGTMGKTGPVASNIRFSIKQYPVRRASARWMSLIYALRQ